MAHLYQSDHVRSEAPAEGIECVKGFDADFRCRGMQYAVGQAYSADGDVRVCEYGLHACEHPLDVLEYYPAVGSRFAVVRAYGSISRKPRGDTKLAAARLAVEAEIGIPELVSRAVAWVVAQCKPAEGLHETGYQGAASSTGYQGAASATGRHGVALAAGIEGRAMAAEGNAIVCCHRNDAGELLHIRAGIAGRDGIKAHTWYRLDAEGAFVEVRS